MILILGSLALAGLFYYYVVRPYSFWKKQGIPHTTPIWVLGDTWKSAVSLEQPGDTVVELYNKFPDVRYAGFYQFLVPSLLIKDPELIRDITIKDFDNFVDHRNFLPANIDPLWGKNLLVLEGKAWKNMRNVLSPSFTSSKLKTMFGLIEDCAKNAVEHFSTKGKGQDIITIEVKDIFSRITNDVIATTSLGVQIDSLSKPDNTFYQMGKMLTDFSTIRAKLVMFGTLISKRFFELIKLSMFAKEARTYFLDIINSNVETREKNNIKRPDMVTLMLEARKGTKKYENGVSNGNSNSAKEKPAVELANDDIAAQAMIFFFGGFDSVSSVMSFTAYELAVNKEIQDRLRKEILDTKKECGGDVSYDEIQKMKYMDMVISESLRKYPNFVATDRLCTKDYVIHPETPDEKPLYIKKGAEIYIPIYGFHHDPKYFPNPERFDPERFSDKNKGNIVPYTYLPFGQGPRTCIGNRFALVEIKIVLFHLLAKFELVPTKETDIPIKFSKKNFNLQPRRLTLGLKVIGK